MGMWRNDKSIRDAYNDFDSKLRLPSLIQHTLFDTNIFSGLGYYFNAILLYSYVKALHVYSLEIWEVSQEW